MTHWLEEAEKEIPQELKKHKVSRTKVLQKADEIKKNYEANKVAYDDFMSTLFDICQRANNLPPEARDPWGMIEAKAKESRMDSHLKAFFTRERFDMRVPTKSFPFMKLVHYKHVRKIMFSISKDMGMSNVEVYEDYVAKSRLNHDDGERERDVVDDGLDRFHLVFHYSIKEFNKDLGLKILDWLAFKEEIDHLPFKEEQIKRLGKTRSTS